jgi:hypothetical protein
MVPAVAVKVVAVAPAGTVTEAAGTGSRALLLESGTLVPPGGAALLRVMVQVLAPAEFRVVGLQASEETMTEPTRLMVADCEALLTAPVCEALPIEPPCDALLNVTVTVAL